MPKEPKIVKDIGPSTTCGTRSTTAKRRIHSYKNPLLKTPFSWFLSIVKTSGFTRAFQRSIPYWNSGNSERKGALGKSKPPRKSGDRFFFFHLSCWEVLPFLTIQRQRCIKILCPKDPEFETPLALNCQKGQLLPAPEVKKIKVTQKIARKVALSGFKEYPLPQIPKDTPSLGWRHSGVACAVLEFQSGNAILAQVQGIRLGLSGESTQQIEHISPVVCTQQTLKSSYHCYTKFLFEDW